jgi:uncharacterized membrane protein YhaH (DUF805 family)
MTLTQAVRSCFSKYATFSGRASWSEYWKFWLLVMIFCIFLNTAIFGPSHETGIRIVTAADGTQTSHPFERTNYNSGVFGTVFWLAVLLPGLAVAGRRLHDTGRCGWWQVMPFVVTPVALTLAILTDVGWPVFIAAWPTPGAHVQTPADLLPAFAVAVGAWLVLLYWLCKKSQPGPNRFGPNPHEVTE